MQRNCNTKNLPFL